MFQTVSLWRQIGISIVLNWVIGPFVRLFSTLSGLMFGVLTG